MPDAPKTIPQTVGSWRVLRELRAANSLLAEDDSRRVILKLLEEDCLWRNRLHPNIQSRLARVREIAHPAVANLLGVERAGSQLYLVWEYVPGKTLAESADLFRDPAALSQLGLQLCQTVARLHALGIVHGNIHERNILLSSQNAPDESPIENVNLPAAALQNTAILTHISPLLYDDPLADVHGLADALAAVAKTNQYPPDQIKLLSSSNFLDLNALQNFLHDPRSANPASTATADSPIAARLRRRTIATIALVLLGAAAIAGAFLHLGRGL